MAIKEADVAAWFATHPQLGHQHNAVRIICWTALAYTTVFALCQRTRLPALLFRAFTKQEVTDWNQRCMETINGLVCLTGFCLCISEAEPNDASWLFGHSAAQEALPSLLVGYMVFDTGFNLYYPELWDTCDIIHHALFITLSGLHLWAGCPYKVQALWLLLGEVVVPFTNLRWHLAVTGQKNSQLYMINGLALWTAFGCGRVVVMAFGLKSTWAWLWNVYTAEAIPPVPHIFHSSLFAILTCAYVLNLFWFWGISRAVLRIVLRLRRRGLFTGIKASRFSQHAARLSAISH